MKFECHHGILKWLSKFGFVETSGLSNSPNVTKETIWSGLNGPARLGYLIRCHGGAFIVLDSLDTIVKNEITYAFENYDTAQEIKESHSTMKGQVCVIGSFNINIIGYLPRLPTIGGPLLVSNFISSPGGKGCNQTLTVSLADTDVYFITKVGADHFSDYAINFMNSSKIYKSIIYQVEETQTGTVTILVNGDTSDNVIMIYPGASMTISSGKIAIWREAIINSDVIPLQPETNYTALQRAITLARKNSIPVIINPVLYNDTVNELIRGIDYITPDETEVGLLSGIDVHDLESTKRAVKAIHNKGVKSTVITLGNRGSLAFGDKKLIHPPAFLAAVKNTAGTGDAFNGTLVSGLAKRKSLGSVLCYANAFTSLAVKTSSASDMSEYESVIHRIQSIHYQQIISTH